MGTAGKLSLCLPRSRAKTGTSVLRGDDMSLSHSAGEGDFSSQSLPLSAARSLLSYPGAIPAGWGRLTCPPDLAFTAVPQPHSMGRELLCQLKTILRWKHGVYALLCRCLHGLAWPAYFGCAQGVTSVPLWPQSGCP